MKTENEQKRITETTLKTLKPKNIPWFVKDTLQKGFQIKILPSGQLTYLVEARLGGKGKVKKFKIGNVADMSLSEARDKAKDSLNLIRSGTDPQIIKKQQLFEGMTLEGLLKAYLSRPKHNLKPRTIKDYQNFFEKQFKPWQKRRVADITKYEILDWYTKGHTTPVHTHNAFRALNALMNYAIGLEVIDTNPCEFVTKNKIRYTIPKRSSHIEATYDLPKFLKAFIEFDFQKDSQKVARDIILLMLTTGLRFGEASSIKFENIDHIRKTILIPDTKNRQDHLVLLVPLTYTMLRYREKDSDKSPYVFRIKGGETKSPHVTDIRKTLHGICDSAKIKQISAHDLRRTFASTLNSIGVGYADTKALMNHKAKDITATYIQDNHEILRNYMMNVVKYYDLKIPFPNNIEAGWSKFGTEILQSNFYKNVQAEFEPINPQDYNEDHAQSLTDDFWLGFDADKSN